MREGSIMDGIIHGLALISFVGLIISWLALPSSTAAAIVGPPATAAS